MTDRHIQAAFDLVLPDAQKPDGCFVSLYANVPYYGGPEEGGWWGNDVALVATQHFEYSSDAKTAQIKIDELAEQLSTRAKRAYGEQCLQETEWLEARGLDDDYLPEPDGELRYFTVTESERGSHNSTGVRHYE